MKKLTLKHAIQTAKLIKAADMKKQVADLIEQATKRGVNKTRLGIDITMTLVDVMANDEVETKLYDLLSDVFETKAEELSLEALAENISKLVKENDVKRFFKLVEKSTQ